MTIIHLVEGAEKRPREGEILWTKCNQRVAFRPPGSVLGDRALICSDCGKHAGITQVPSFLAVSTPLSKSIGI